MKLVNFIVSNADSIILIAFALAVIAVIVYLIYKKKLGEVLYTLITDAETQNPAGTGEYKFAGVLTRLYAYLPRWLTLIIPEKTVSEWIENALDIARKRWEESGILEKLGSGDDGVY